LGSFLSVRFFAGWLIHVNLSFKIECDIIPYYLTPDCLSKEAFSRGSWPTTDKTRLYAILARMAGIRLQEEMSGSHAPGKVLHLRPPIRRDPPHAEDVALSPRVAGAGQRMSRAARDFPRPAISPATVSGIEQALRERDQLTLAPFGTPRHAAVRQDAHDHATGGAAECLHAIAWFEIGGLA